MNIVTWSEDFSQGRVQRDANVDLIDSKPDIDFEFDSVYYEPPTELYRKVVGDVTIQLSNEELTLCSMFIQAYKF